MGSKLLCFQQGLVHRIQFNKVTGTAGAVNGDRKIDFLILMCGTSKFKRILKCAGSVFALYAVCNMVNLGSVALSFGGELADGGVVIVSVLNDVIILFLPFDGAFQRDA